MNIETAIVWSPTLDEDFKRIPRELVERLSGKRVLVTGATGLVGSLIVRYLLFAREAYSLDIGIIGVVRGMGKARSIYGDRLDLAEWVEADLSLEEPDCEGAVDYIVHAAAVTTSRTMVERPVDVIGLSVDGTRAMLELARRKGAVLLYLSSMEAYGTVEADGPVDEGTFGYIDVLAPRSCYPEGKRLCENLCVAYGTQYGVDARIARLAQTFGAGVLPGENRAVVSFCRAASCGEPLVLKTRGLSEANYVYGSDAVSALLTILLDGASGEAYNVSNEACHTTISGMAELVVSTVGVSGAAVSYEIDESNASGFAADVKLFLSARKLRSLGWEPKVDLPEAMTRLVSFLKEQD